MSKCYRLDKIAHALKISRDVSHRALADCRVTLDIYNYLQAYLQSNNIHFSVLLPKAKLSAKDISSSKTDFDENHPLFDKICVFTGTLDKLLRKDAMQIVVDLGGKCADNVTKKTNYLILGATDYRKRDDKSNKQKKAEQFQLSGLDIETISENVFYDMVLSTMLYEQLDNKQTAVHRRK